MHFYWHMQPRKFARRRHRQSALLSGQNSGRGSSGYSLAAGNIAAMVAEAAHLEAAGETFGIPQSVWASAAVVQEAARSVSAVEELLLYWFTKPAAPNGAGYFVLSSDIVNALTMARQNANAKFGRVMERLGYADKRPYLNGVQQRAWIKSVDGKTTNCTQLVPAQSVNGGAVEMRMRRDVSS
jgi:hypothetical protein